MTEDGIAELVGKMTLEEKASLCSGRDFWSTKAVERLGIESWMMTDGPHGLRKKAGNGDEIGLNESVPATCFPSGAGLGATWNEELIEQVGSALGIESQAENVGVILGPAVNIKRSPLCGRNFEYLSEDPFLAGSLAKAHIRGVQKQGVGTSLKHFAANNQEKSRMTIDARVDERTLREIYLPAFEKAVTEAKPWTVMCAYNRLNGIYCSQNAWLLRTVLKKEWGFDGVLMTDWGACDDRAAGIAAGQDLEMPYSGPANDRTLTEAVRGGSLDEKLLDEAVARNLRLYFRVVENRGKAASFDAGAHHVLARKVAAEAAVLLKNENSALPLVKSGKIAFIGAFAKKPRYQGGGSSHINPTRLGCAWEAAQKIAGRTATLVYAPGYDIDNSEPIPALIAEARTAAESADAAVVFIGLTDDFESEGFDRKHIRIPEGHAALVREIAACAKKTIVVLSNGAPIEMPWLSEVDAVVEGYLGGQAGGEAAAEVLFGDVEPSGRLAETFPLRLEDTSSHLNFPGGKEAVEYREGVFVGYRYFDSADVPVLFPFGHGLSYTKFAYETVSADRESISDEETVIVTATVRNTGPRRGKEVVQLYVEPKNSSVVRPRKELKGFAKLELAPGETGVASFTLGKRAFAYWDAGSGSWRAESGEYDLLIAASVSDIRLRTAIRVVEKRPPKRVFDRNTQLGDLLALKEFEAVSDRILQACVASFGATEPNSPLALMAEAMFRELPLRNVGWLAGSALSEEALEAMIEIAAGNKSPEGLAALLGKKDDNSD